MINPEYNGILAVAFLFLGLGAVSRAAEPPRAKKVPYKLEKHGQVRVDDYYWLKERGNPEVTAYLKAENEYTEAVFRPLEPLREKLFNELKARIKQDDSTVPFKYGGYYYYKTFKAGKEYPVYARKKGSPDAPEEVVLDVNELAAGKGFCDVRFPVIRPDHKMIAYAMDTGGRRFYDVYFKDLESGKVYGEKIERTAGNLAWANDNRTLFYVKQHPETLRWERVLAHELGAARDREVYHEADETFEVGISRSATEKYIFIRTGATLSTEYLLIDADAPGAAPVLFAPRSPKLEYDVEDGGEKFYILNNDKARNFKLSVCPSSDTSRASWRDLVPHRDETLLENLQVFSDWFILLERADALGRLHVFNRVTGLDSYVDFNEPAYL
ncbi:MAG: oligopeptidase B, partial [Elusimicrobia bacterium CG08_land_8_20_14_0_20_59_10]